MECQNARSLIPSYLDGELTQAQAGPLRQHLLDCQPCRGSAQDGKNLKRWFAASEPVAVPAGFAARVARRALQGDTGEFPPSLAAPRAEEERGRMLRFVLTCTAAAAALLFVLSLGMRQLALPHSDRMLADSSPQLSRAIQELDRLNAAERKQKRAELDAVKTKPKAGPDAPLESGKKP
ncbi:MAG: zf-HC2 domain-containing protein [Planctomycetes bacterium]|nr:zf-HC2 domain-containing protein [Planctomycetota bacterium]